MAQNYNPKSGVAYWGKFENRFPEIETILRQEFGLVEAWGPNKAVLVAEENGRGLWHVHFAPASVRREMPDPLDTIAFEYWKNRGATEEDFKRDPMRKAAERIYRFLEKDIQRVTQTCIAIPISVPWV